MSQAAPLHPSCLITWQIQLRSRHKSNCRLVTNPCVCTVGGPLTYWILEGGRDTLIVIAPGNIPPQIDIFSRRNILRESFERKTYIYTVTKIIVVKMVIFIFLYVVMLQSFPEKFSYFPHVWSQEVTFQVRDNLTFLAFNTASGNHDKETMSTLGHSNKERQVHEDNVINMD